MTGRWIFDFDRLDEGEEVMIACQVGETQDTTRLLARLHWWQEGDGTRVLKFQDTVVGAFLGVKDGPFPELRPYAYQPLDGTPALDEF